MSKKIAIVGAGVGGLHLALYLQQHGVDVSVYSERTPDAYQKIPILGTIAHQPDTVLREAELGIHHWPGREFGYDGHNYWVGTPTPVQFYGQFKNPARSVDYRLYLPTLIEDYAARGGKIEYRKLGVDDIEKLSEQVDLVVVTAGRGSVGDLFGIDHDYSPYDRPQRALVAGIFKGIVPTQPRAVNLHFSPKQGELYDWPIQTFGGEATTLYIANHFNTELEQLATTDFQRDPDAYIKLLLGLIQQHYPPLAERIDEKEFGFANDTRDLLQIGITPRVRQSHAVLSNGKVIVAAGDTHAQVDPAMGEGANVASFGALVLGEEIVKSDVFDLRFVEHVDRRRLNRIRSTTRWVNFMLEGFNNLPDEFTRFIHALEHDRKLADLFTENFNSPEAQWDALATEERRNAWIATHSSVTGPVVDE